MNIDEFTNIFNTNAAANLMFYAKLEPVTGNIIAGQYRCVRYVYITYYYKLISIRASGRANTVDSQRADLAVNEKGDLYVAGIAACCMFQKIFLEF
ncbi:MAG: hypothetical protein ACK42K_07450 [Leptonema sp. (in: bacteria)]